MLNINQFPTGYGFVEEDVNIINFMIEKSKNVDSPFTLRKLDQEYSAKNISKCRRSSEAYQPNSFFYRRIVWFRSKLHLVDNLDIDTKVKMIFALSAPIDIDFLNVLQKDAIVKVDEEQRITEYTANDGSLKLNGDHSVAAKRKAKLAERQKRYSPDTSEDEDEVNDDEDEEEREDKVKEKEAKEEKKNAITRSGRMSKDRYPNVDFSRDSDDDEFESSSSKINRDLAKNHNSTNLTPKISRLKLQKRQIVDDSCSSESPSKIAKPEKVGVTQNDKNSVLKSGESQEDVIFDGPGEPSLPILLPIKPEREDNYEYSHEQNEHKPDRSELSNPQQNSRDNIINAPDFDNSQVLMNHPNDEIVKNEETETPEIICDTSFVPINSSARNEVENTAELASSKNFMNFLRGLIVTLDTPMLVVLQRKIENTFEELGNEEKIPATDILTALRTIFLAVRKSAKPIQPSKESKSLVGFLMMLRNNVILMNLSVLNDFQEEIKETIKELDSEDKSVPIQSIRIVLDTVLLMFT